MSSESRKLTSIVFADIVGYTAIMQTDERKALQILDTFREILESEMDLHQGQIVQFFGDGCLLAFDSALNGLHAATSLQRGFQLQKIPVRIGMHLGDVIFKNNNAFGDGVNVASRIESLGIPGAVLLSKSLYDQVRNKTEFSLTSLGEFQFKNVTDKMEVFAVANEGFPIPKPEQMRGKLEIPLPSQPSKEEQKEWEHYQLLEILDAVEEGSCVLILGNHAFSKPGPEGEIFLPDILQQEMEKLTASPSKGGRFDFYSAAQTIANRPGGHRKLLRLTDLQWQDLGPTQRKRFERISQIPFDLILSTYPFDLCHEAFTAHGIDHQYDFYSYMSEATEPEPFDASRPLIYNLFGNKRHKESLVISLEQLYQFFFAVLGARPLPKLIQDKVQRATQLVFLGFSFDDWYMKLLLRVLKVHEKEMSYAHSPDAGSLRYDNQLFYESNFKVTFLDRQIDTFIGDLQQLCLQEGLIRKASKEPESELGAIRDLVTKFRLEEAMDQLDEVLVQGNFSARLLRKLGDYFREYHSLKEDDLYERSPAEVLERRWKILQGHIFDLIERMESNQLA